MENNEKISVLKSKQHSNSYY